MTTPIDLSIIIPAYNEEPNLSRGVFQEVTNYLQTQKFSWELIFVNDGSRDRTLELLRKSALQKSNIKIIDHPHMGKAAAILAGVSAASGRIILFSDMDQATPISEISRFLPKFTQGYDVVIGSRSNRQGAPVYRQILAYGMIIFRTLLLRLPFRDTQCGFKAFSKAAADKIFACLASVHAPKTVSEAAVNPGFDVEILYIARKLGFRICEVPVAWRHQESKRVRFLKDALSGVVELIIVRFRSLTNAYHL